MTKDNSYRSIVKANALLGGVQVYTILISIIRSKVVAVLLGPQGMGIMGLLNSTVALVQSVTNFGLNTSAVREIAVAADSGDDNKIAEIKTVLQKIVWITGLLGIFITLIFAPALSQFTFGTDEYTFAFICLSITLLLAQLTIGYNAILQGLRQLKSLAMANVTGNSIALLLCIPLYYFFGTDAIVPVIIITSGVILAATWFFARKIKLQSIVISTHETFAKGRSMMVMGFLISLTGFMDTIVAYLIRILINLWGDLSEVGLYNAGYAMITSYVGLVFSSIATDYFPRLSMVSNDMNERNKVICQQGDILLLILCPLVLLFIFFGDILIRLLYSVDFLSVVEMVNWIALGMMFRAITWCPGFLYLAKGDSKLYFIIYVITTIVVLGISVLFYYLLGLTGLGVAFLVTNVLSFISTIFITKWKYGFKYQISTMRLGTIQIIFCALALFSSYLHPHLKYSVCSVLMVLSFAYSYRELNRRLNLKSIFGSIYKRFFSK